MERARHAYTHKNSVQAGVNKIMKALLALEDGRTFPCRRFTGPGESSGEVVFNTSMTGYQEILTDPSYYGQMVTMTYPLIGKLRGLPGRC